MTDTDTPFKLGFRAGREGLASSRCPFPKGTTDHEVWQHWRRVGQRVGVGNGKLNDDPWCQHQADCRARRKKLCAQCNMKRLHADPEFAARRDARINAARLGMTDEQRAKFLAAARGIASKVWDDPARRKKQAAIMRELHKRPGFLEATAKRNSERFKNDPARREQQAAILRKAHADPETAKKRKKTRIERGYDISRSIKRAAAREIRDTEDTYEVIAKRFEISFDSVVRIAKEYVVQRRRK